MNFKRIMLLSHEMTYTGAPNSLLNVAELLKKHGHKISIATLKAGNFEKEFVKKGFSVTIINEKNFDCSLLCGYDLLIANTVFCADFAISAQKYVHTVLYIREAGNLTEIIADCGLREDCISSAENVICVSEYAEMFIKKQYRVNKLYVLHNFLNMPALYRPRKNISKNGKVHFLLVGTIEKRKGIDIALDAVNCLDDEIKQRTVLHIVGRKPEWSRKYWERLNFALPNVIYYGEITDKRKMRHLYNKVNCVIVPSRDESCSLSALEAAMTGRAVIVSDNVGAKYIVEGNGFVIRSEAAEELAKAMSFMINNTAELEFMGHCSYKNFLRTSTAEIYYKEMNEIFKKLKE